MTTRGPARRFSTGTDSLDRMLDGGLPVGDLLALVGPPESQSELLLAHLAATRETLYVDTSGAPEAELRERFPDDESTSVLAVSPSELLANPTAVAEQVRPESFVLLDAADPLEAVDDRERYLAVLNALKRRLRESDSIGVLHCFDRDDPPAQRPATLHRADDVWQIHAHYGKREIRYQLYVTKSRYGRAMVEPVPLRLTDRVRIDTSWNI